MSGLDRLPDEAARQRAQLEFQRPLVVEAGAGTGKTALLVARIAAWCVGPGWRRHAGDGAAPEEVARLVLDRLVAITFTEAAAAEMATRVAEVLAGLAVGATPPGWTAAPEDEDASAPLAAHAGHLLGEIHRLRVHTIHAFCQRLLRSYPLEAGLHPLFEVDADGQRAAELVAEVVDGALRDDPAGEEGQWRTLAAAGVGPAALAEALTRLVSAGVRPAELERDPCGAAAATAARQRLVTAVDSFLQAEDGRLEGVRGSRSLATRDAVGRLAEAVLFLPPDAGFEQVGGCCALLDTASLDRLRLWAAGKLSKSEAERLGPAAAAVERASAGLAEVVGDLRRVAAVELAAARGVLAPLLRRVRDRMTAAGVVTFDDLLGATVTLLESSSRVLAEVRGGLDQLLVDEFQDTDGTQCRIVELLALAATDDDPAAPGLFVVGDPKQSIYGWRRADLAAYESFVGRLLRAGGERLELTANFRSVAPILAEVERLVAPVMVAEAAVQPGFVRLDPTAERVWSPGFDVAPRSAVELWVGWGGEDGLDPAAGRAGDAVLREAAAIAADIRELHDRDGVPWGEVAILLRTTSHQEELLTALRAAGVPCDVSREREYYRQREVIEAASLVRTVLEPGDALALLAVLRSDLVGVPDGALAPLWDAGLAASMAAVHGPEDAALADALAAVARVARERPPGSERLPSWPEAAVAGLRTIAALRALERTAPPDRLVAALRRLTCVEATAGARYLGASRRARLERFFAELEGSIERTLGSSAAVARLLRQAIEEGRESRLPPAPATDADAVHVMTIHGAKGLDFGHVYLAQCHTGSGSGPRGVAFEAARDGRDLEYTLLGWSTPGMGAALRRAARREAAERVRLLYVATTRAKRRLVVSGWWKNAGEEVPPDRATSFGDLVVRRADPEALAAQAAAGDARRPDAAAHVQWVLPALLEGVASAAGASGSGTGGEDVVAAAEEDAAVLRELRRAAGTRQALPAGGRVTAEVHRDELTAAESEPAPAQTMPVRSAATAAGTAVHAMLEGLDLSLPLAPQLAASAARLHEWVPEGLDEVATRAARRRVGELLGGLEGSACLRRLEAVAGDVVARELPLLDRVRQDDAVGFVAGTVDLLYRDPADDGLVVADYKTDAVADDAALAERVERYRPQLERYALILTEALGLPTSPRCELWFLEADRIVEVGSPSGGG